MGSDRKPYSFNTSAEAATRGAVRSSVMATMKALRIHNYGGSDELVYEEAPRPEPGDGQVLVRVRAASVSPIDWKMREGYLQQWIPLSMPAILGRDLAGDVVAIGPDVTHFQVGDAVFGMANMST